MSVFSGDGTTWAQDASIIISSPGAVAKLGTQMRGSFLHAAAGSQTMSLIE